MDKSIYLSLLLFFCFSCKNSIKAEFSLAQISAISYTEQINEMEDELSKSDFQNRIKDAFVQSMFAKNYRALDSLELELDNLFNKSNANIFVYWKVYSNFHKALLLDINGESGQAEKIIYTSMQSMEDLENKNTEDYALLAYVCSYYIKFLQETTDVINYSKLSKKYANFAKDLDPENPRSYYVLGSLDFYTPTNYGGGRTLENDFLKAIGLPDQKVKNEVLPSWGHEEAYEMLIRFYIREKDLTSAKKYFKEASEKFPDNYQISKLASELID